MALKKGDQIRQRVFVAQGAVADVRYDADTGAFQYLMTYTDEAGQPTERWFDEGAVELAPQEGNAQ
jgi:hypothetical protein